MIFEFIMKVKKDYMKKFGNISYEYENNSSCINRWVEELGNEEYKDILSNVNIRQNKDLIILKYVDFEVTFTRNPDISYLSFWNMYDGIYRECRGTVIDIVNDKLVMLPYIKFFNINEVPETQEGIIKNKITNAKKVEFSNKLDGSLVSARYYNGEIIVASSGKLANSIILKFARKVIDSDSHYQKFIKDFSDYTLIFESINVDDMHVVVYQPEEFGLYLTGMRNMNTMELLSYEEVINIAKEYGVRSTEQYLVSFSDIIEMKKTYKSSEKEGYVMNIDGELVKIKCDDYIFLSKMAKNNCSAGSIIKAIYFNRLDDLRASVPEAFLPVIDDIVSKIQKYCFIMEETVNSLLQEAPKDKIEFFAWVKTQPKYLARYLSSAYLGKEFSYLVVIEAGDSSKFVKFADMEKILEEHKK